MHFYFQPTIIITPPKSDPSPDSDRDRDVELDESSHDFFEDEDDILDLDEDMLNVSQGMFLQLLERPQ